MPEARIQKKISDTEKVIGATEGPQVSADAVMSAFEQIFVAMSASGAVVAVRDVNGVRCVVSFGNAPSVGSRLQPDSVFTRECIEKDTVVLSEDTQNDQRVRPGTAKSLNLRSAVAVPIHAQGSVVGLIEVFSARPYSISPTAIGALQRVAELFANIMVFEPGPRGELVIAPPLAWTQAQTPIAIVEAPKDTERVAEGFSSSHLDSSTAISSELKDVLTQTSLPTEIQTRGQPSGTPNNTEELVDPLYVAVAPRPPAWSPASQIESSAAEKSWQAVPAPNVAAVQEEATSPAAQGTETGSPPEFTLGHARASENTTEPDQASTRNNKGTLISAVAAGFLVLAAGSASYLRITSSPARSKLTAAVSQPPASVVVSQSLPQDGTARRATFPGDVTLASPTVTTAHTNTQSAAASTQPISVSAVLPGYPLLAKNQHLEGDVRVDAVIDVNGRVTATKAVSGPVLLQQAAVDALRQWKYRPATLNGKPVPMHLSVTIRFRVR
jgi:TonB family protein